MFETSADFHQFYTGTIGRAIIDRVCTAMDPVWERDSPGRVLGYGYCFPFLDRLMTALASAAPSVLLPSTLGGIPDDRPIDPAYWIETTHETAWPVATHSVDRILMIHGLELGGPITPILAEAWRVLTSQGKLIMVVPNRLGIWSRLDSSPFGHGRPFLSVQMQRALRATNFIHEQTIPTLFALPAFGAPDSAINCALEWMGPRMTPALAGLHIMTARKHLYGGIKKETGPSRTAPLVPRLQTAAGFR